MYIIGNALFKKYIVINKIIIVYYYNERNNSTIIFNENNYFSNKFVNQITSNYLKEEF